MAEKYYFDTSIWLDIYEKRGSNGEAAFKLMEKAIEEDAIVAYSDMVVKEFKRLDYTLTEISVILSIAKPRNIMKVHIYREQAEEASKLAFQRGVPKADAFHAVLARDNDMLLVSRDGDFGKLKDIVQAKILEDII